MIGYPLAYLSSKTPSSTDLNLSYWPERMQSRARTKNEPKARPRRVGTHRNRKGELMTRMVQFMTGALLFFLAISHCAPGKAMQVPERHGPPWAGAVSASTIVHLGTSTIQIDFGPGGFNPLHDILLLQIETTRAKINLNRTRAEMHGG